MKKTVFSFALAGAVMFGASSAHAACTATYKAKRDNPLELFVLDAKIQGPCTKKAARAELQAKLAKQGLTLLKVLSVKKK